VNRVRTKICGITCIEDALCAVELGADALGFMFYQDSGRYIDPYEAGQIIAQLPPFVMTVGVFVNPEAAVVSDALMASRVQLIQFHGDESDDFCNQFGRPYIKALRVSAELDLVSRISQYKFASGILLDAFVPGEYGGTGETFSWNLVPHHSDQPIILAGGLTADNVESAIRQTLPYGVDVSGGVESSKGRKDPQKMRLFLETVRGITEHD